MSFAEEFIGEVMADVFVTALAAATWAAAEFGDLDEAGGEDGAFGSELCDARVGESADESGVAGNLHMTDKYIGLSEIASKNLGAKKRWVGSREAVVAGSRRFERGTDGLQSGCQCEKPLILQS